MQLRDLHIHSRFSGDCDTELTDICERAISSGVREVAFTDHVDFNPLDGSYYYLKPVPYLDEIGRCRDIYGDRLTIRSGVEISEPHIYVAETERLLTSHQFDLVIGSLHWVGSRPDWNSHYFEGFTFDEGMRAYFDELERMVTDPRSDFDILGHLDMVRRPVYYSFGRTDIDYAPYEDQIRRILRSLIERGRTLEINTATYRRGMGDTCPSLQVLRWYVDEGGAQLTLGSDAHTADSIAACFDYAAELARAAGLTRLVSYENRQVIWIGLD